MVILPTTTGDTCQRNGNLGSAGIPRTGGAIKESRQMVKLLKGLVLSRAQFTKTEGKKLTGTDIVVRFGQTSISALETLAKKGTLAINYELQRKPDRALRVCESCSCSVSQQCNFHGRPYHVR